MKKHKYILVCLLSLLGLQTTKAQGLLFNSSELPINQRTSYNVFGMKSPIFTDSLILSFDLSFYPQTPIGFIFRLKDQNKKIYNLFYEMQGDNLVFKLNKEGQYSLITARINKNELIDSSWVHLYISFNLSNKDVVLGIGHQKWMRKDSELGTALIPILIFGKSEYIIDVPSVAIRDICINHDKEYHFPLNENKGEKVHNEKGKAIGNVVNPYWLINDSYRWKRKMRYASVQVAGVNYSPLHKEIYYFNQDSIISYNVHSGEISKQAYSKRCPVKMLQGSNFLMEKEDILCVYELFYPNDTLNNISMATLDLQGERWCPISNNQISTQLFHHTGYLDTIRNRYLIFGGFGYMHFSNLFRAFDFQTGKWQTLNQPKGDRIQPRYFSSMGYREKDNSLYIFGGMGNESGEQEVGRHYFYDLFQLKLDQQLLKRKWTLNWGKTNMVPVKEMFFDGDYFYTLCYPESISESYLQLYRFSLKDGSHQIFGDSIPIRSDKITTNARLFYDKQENCFIVTVQEFENNDISSQLTVYTLNSPPLRSADLDKYAQTRGWIRFGKGLLIVALLIAMSLLFFMYYRKKRKDDQQNSDILLSSESAPAQKSDMSPRANSIYLFGDFMVRDSKNRDITYLFSARKKELFLLLLQNSIDQDGISSKQLSELLWPNKTEEKVKNLRGVNINQLRKILQGLNGIELIFQKGHFKIIYTDKLYCDYVRFHDIISGPVEKIQKHELALILERGKFMKGADDPLYDRFKGLVENQIEKVSEKQMNDCFEKSDFELALFYANALLNVDPLNEKALKALIKSQLQLKNSSEAYGRYHHFVLEYMKTYGKDYAIKYKDLIHS